MKKIVAMILSVALAFPAASLLAQQAPAPAAKQPVQVAVGAEPGAFSVFGMGTLVSAAIVVGLVLVVANAVDGNDTPATATR